MTERLSAINNVISWQKFATCDNVLSNQWAIMVTIPHACLMHTLCIVKYIFIFLCIFLLQLHVPIPFCLNQRFCYHLSIHLHASVYPHQSAVHDTWSLMAQSLIPQLFILYNVSGPDHLCGPVIKSFLEGCVCRHQSCLTRSALFPRKGSFLPQDLYQLLDGSMPGLSNSEYQDGGHFL